MKILPFNELGKIDRKDIFDSKKMVKKFLENHPKVAFACFYGGVITPEFDEYSDIDVFVIYQDIKFIHNLESAYLANQFGKTEIEWNLIPYTLLQDGIAKEQNYLNTLMLNNQYITGYQEILINAKCNSDPLLQFLLRKLTKALEFYVKGSKDVKELSKIMRSVEHIPRKILNYTGRSKDKLLQKYCDSIESYTSINQPYLKLINAISLYKKESRKITSEKEYQSLLMQIRWYIIPYIQWLHDVYLLEQEKHNLEKIRVK